MTPFKNRNESWWSSRSTSNYAVWNVKNWVGLDNQWKATDSPIFDTFFQLRKVFLILGRENTDFNICSASALLHYLSHLNNGLTVPYRINVFRGNRGQGDSLPGGNRTTFRRLHNAIGNSACHCNFNPTKTSLKNPPHPGFRAFLIATEETVENEKRVNM